jgi:hypothetical protein
VVGVEPARTTRTLAGKAADREALGVAAGVVNRAM